MSLVAIGLNALLSALLIIALWMGFRLNRRLNALRESHEGFATAVAELDRAAQRAEHGLSALREATDEAVDLLSDRIEKARTLAAKLERQVDRAHEPRILDSRPSAPRAGGEIVPMPRRTQNADREHQVSEADVERVAHRLGSLLSAAREARQRPPAPPEVTAGAKPSRQKPGYEDELFDETAGADDLVLRKSATGRR
ncbi:MAG: flagellar positioning protein PflI [Phenylobacterium zucineum]|nr:MAG: flagellar positioning protein PflI [Phenylobacterium zucineum]